jgi:hypothetical protein
LAPQAPEYLRTKLALPIAARLSISVFRGSERGALRDVPTRGNPSLEHDERSIGPDGSNTHRTARLDGPGEDPDQDVPDRFPRGYEVAFLRIRSLNAPIFGLECGLHRRNHLSPRNGQCVRARLRKNDIPARPRSDQGRGVRKGYRLMLTSQYRRDARQKRRKEQGLDHGSPIVGCTPRVKPARMRLS